MCHILYGFMLLGAHSRMTITLRDTVNDFFAYENICDRATYIVLR